MKSGLNLGSRGEQQAATYLKRKKIKVLGANLRLKIGEIDLLAQDGRTLVLVEVKTKTSLEQGSPFDMVTLRKQRKLRLLAAELGLHYPGYPIRIDVIGILEQPHTEPEIVHIVNAVEGS